MEHILQKKLRGDVVQTSKLQLVIDSRNYNLTNLS